MGFSWVQINVQSNIQQSARDMVITECIIEEIDAHMCDDVQDQSWFRVQKDTVSNNAQEAEGSWEWVM